MAIYTDPTKRHDFIMLFDVADGNPNGDPDAGNLPRVDPETNQGLVTDVCLKRKVRNYVDLTKGDEGRNKIYVQNKGVALNTQHQRAYDALKIKSTGSKQKREDVDRTRAWMCQNFYDIRMFGAVMTMGVNCGQVRGPIQLTFARSITPVFPMDVSITRVAVTRPEDAEVTVGEEGKTSGKQTEMGRKPLVPYGLYRGHGFVNSNLGKQTGMTEEDLTIFWEALQNMWDHDRSAARGLMAIQGLWVFSHENVYGNAPANKLFERLDVDLKDGTAAPRSVNDYAITVREQDLPEGITLTQLV